MYVIMIQIESDEAPHLTELFELFECKPDGTLLLFHTADEAAEYREKNGLDGKIIELIEW